MWKEGVLKGHRAMPPGIQSPRLTATGLARWSAESSCAGRVSGISPHLGAPSPTASRVSAARGKWRTTWSLGHGSV